MAVIYFDGFDLGNITRDDGLSTGHEDYGNYWSGGSLTGSRSYVAGHNGGNAIAPNYSVSRGVGNLGQGNPLPASHQMRFGAWVYNEWSTSDVPEAAYTPVFMSIAVTSNAGAVGLRADASNTSSWTLKLGYFEDELNGVPTTDSEWVELASLGAIDLNDWTHYELYVDWDAHNVQVRKNGAVVASVTDPVLTFVGTPSGDFYCWMSNAISDLYGRLNMAFDDVYITDGSPVIGVPLAAVAHGASCYQDAASARLRAFLRIGGTKYDHALAQGDTINAFDITDYRNIFWFWPTNPATSADWTTADFANIQNWGFCYVDAGNHSITVSTMSLFTLGDVDGLPGVSRYHSWGKLELSGNWVKSDPGKSYGSHVGEAPRGTPGVDDEQLTISSPGCIQWTPNQRQPIEGLLFSEESNPNYVDYEEATGGEDFSSEFITGYKIPGGGDKAFQNNYVTVHSKAVASGSAFLQGVWDYATSGNSGRWSQRQNVYPPTYSNVSDVMRKLKVRGHGRVFQIRVTSEPGKPFRINGWTVQVLGNQFP